LRRCRGTLKWVVWCLRSRRRRRDVEGGAELGFRDGEGCVAGDGVVEGFEEGDGRVGVCGCVGGWALFWVFVSV